ncbi:MAG: multiheme c-type cytochrome [Woeseiaceae bacterium]|nr:multiheme c-type cytochrome [Woeseiaceae bacterium]
MNRPAANTGASRAGFCAVAMTLALAAGAAELPDRAAAIHMGVATCATSQCHGSAAPRDGSNVLQNEYVTWTREDPHSGAYDTLGGAESRAIARRLGLQDATSAAICLDCHADNVSPARRGERFQLSDGVGCEACHGGAEHWLSTHYNVPAVDHEANVAAGMYPTADVVARAELCLSCHLGTADKFATHRIMAAGHPRLTFELDTFSELWQHAGRQPHYRIDEDYVARKGSIDHVTAWASGVIAEARQRMRLVAGNVFDGDGLFPELGLYDCHACHRSMKSVDWRALPRHGGAGPGTPFLNDGALVMVLALVSAIEPGRAERFENALVALHVAGGRDAARVRDAARQMDSILAGLQSRVTAAALAGRERALLRELLETGAAGNYLDYASAEQAFMAVQMLVFELGGASLAAKLEPLGDALDDDERFRPATFARLLAELGDN